MRLLFSGYRAKWKSTSSLVKKVYRGKSKYRIQ